MIMPTNGNNKESIFPESQWNYSERAASCKGYYGVDPRPNWISTEFGGHVSIEFCTLYHKIYLGCWETEYLQGLEEVWEQYYLL